MNVPTMQQHEHLAQRVGHIERKLETLSTSTAGVPDWWTRKQTAEYLQTSVSSVDRMIDAGTLTARREGPALGLVRISFESIKRHKEATGIDGEYLQHELQEFLAGRTACNLIPKA